MKTIKMISVLIIVVAIGAYFIVKTTKCHRDGPGADNAAATSEGLAEETDLL